jgi:creatinine deaminase
MLNGDDIQGKKSIRGNAVDERRSAEGPLARHSQSCFNRRMDPFLQAAMEEAKQGLAEGGIPIGSVLVLDGKIIGRGHNRRVQHGSVIHHAEMNCLENAGRLPASVYQRCVLYSTLSPCPMCSGAALLYKIPRLVVGENVTFQGPEDYVRSQGVKVEVVQDPTCIALMRGFIQARPELWNEDIGV